MARMPPAATRRWPEWITGQRPDIDKDALVVLVDAAPHRIGSSRR
jgi:hypothetical protein